jgi:hypothetical protein
MEDLVWIADENIFAQKNLMEHEGHSLKHHQIARALKHL